MLLRKADMNCALSEFWTVMWAWTNDVVWVQGTARERFNEIQQELSQLSTKFSNTLLDATKAYKKLLKDPAEVRFCLVNALLLTALLLTAQLLTALLLIGLLPPALSLTALLLTSPWACLSQPCSSWPCSSRP